MFIAMKTAVLLSLLIVSSALAEVQRATATWTTTKTATTGGLIQTVIKMKVSDGWHTYWKNPGEGGIPLKIEAKLPDGWKLGEIQYPAPKRYTTGELPSIGYGGEVLLPITIYPPKGAKSDGTLPEIKANLSWLTCNDTSCVPGEADLILSATEDAAVIQKAYDATPKPLEGAKLAFVADKNQVTLTLTLPEKSKIDPTTFDAFPVTPDAISAASELRFNATEGKPSTWTAIGKSSEYLDVKINSFSIELFKAGETAWSISSVK
jgi:DsbC/DsbD-like thiol-disulfide interchange protein